MPRARQYPWSARQSFEQQNRPSLALTVQRPAGSQSLHRDKHQLGDPNPRGPQGLHHVIQPLAAPPSGGGQQGQVLPLVQFPGLLPKNFPLLAQGLHPALKSRASPERQKSR